MNRRTAPNRTTKNSHESCSGRFTGPGSESALESALGYGPERGVDTGLGTESAIGAVNCPAVGKSALYTAEQRARRDNTRWTLVQGVLAPLQFLIFIVSAVLIVRFLLTGQGYLAATMSVVIKTAVLYLIMVTGAIWERVVFGQYLFAAPFFWEDVVSMLVMLLHTLYLLALATGALGASALMILALAAYLSYVVNAAQFVYKFRLARRQPAESGLPGATGTAANRSAVQKNTLSQRSGFKATEFAESTAANSVTNQLADSTTELDARARAVPVR